MRLALGGHYPVDRRTFLVAGGLGFFGMNLANAAAYGAGPPSPGRRPTARSAIMLWLSGGASHIDTWDLKPDAPAEYRVLSASVQNMIHRRRFCPCVWA
jgi:hypothetical protein